MRSIGFDTKPLKHFDVSVSNAACIYRLSQDNPNNDEIRRIANTCRDLLRGSKIYIARDLTDKLLAKAIAAAWSGL